MPQSKDHQKKFWPQTHETFGRWMSSTFSLLKNTSLAAMYRSKIWWDAITFNHKEVSNGFNRTVDRQAWSDVDQPVGNERLANKPRFPCLPIEQNGGLLTKQITLRNHPAPTYSLNYPLPTTTTGRDDKPPVRGREQLPIRHMKRAPRHQNNLKWMKYETYKIYQILYK